ncbi:M3 family metallopeptidase [Solimicrobium silvestre]|uniref:oligopeptidase A n=1 Tax=Solimicrobium silvestre TaxID=2099400 RepID=A0A2S9GWK9_9BURK|nr:M3 family metallopeptidase [Solimicrobium silvestre]PRC92117.1 Zn-dependent oligopeptidase [Solimicrobium silvestre]
MTNPNTNPLVDFTDLPRFDAITADDVAPAITALLEQCKAVVTQIENDPVSATWENVVEPLENATEKLSRAWGIISHLHGVCDTPELRAAYNENQPLITEFFTALGQNLVLFKKYQALHDGPEFTAYSVPRKKIIQNAIRDFKLSGAELAADKKLRYAEIQEQVAALSTKFSENILDATNHYSLHIDNAEALAGLPEDALLAARTKAEQAEQSGYLFGLQFPSFYPVLQYANDRALRATIYRANTTKASDLGENPEWDNTELMQQILALRNEEAHLLGYANFAQVSLVAKMAESTEQVSQFLLDLAARAQPFAVKDLEELRHFAKETLGLDDLQAHDIAYASEKLREQRYAFSEQEVKQYFPEPQVIQGLFSITNTLYGVDIKPDQASTWHPDVKFFRIEKNGQLIGQFYLDLYARDGKQGGAWMDDARGRRSTADGIQTPVAYLTCNFTAPAANAPAYFTHDEVITLFHEFGHGLHHMLTQVDELGVSGLSGVEWDAVELPSQFMENFCWEWEVLQQMSAHSDTGQPLPRALYDKMLAAKNFQSGLQTLRQVELSLFDMRLHDGYLEQHQLSVQALLNQIRAQISVMKTPEFNRFQHAFSHIFAGGYAAGYFSYKWAEVLSADAYAAFEEAGNNAEIGIKFQKEILAVGGSRTALESFIAFRGRAPEIDALLRHSGMKS